LMRAVSYGDLALPPKDQMGFALAGPPRDD
jgi:hypothetical protein